MDYTRGKHVHVFKHAMSPMVGKYQNEKYSHITLSGCTASG